MESTPRRVYSFYTRRPFPVAGRGRRGARGRHSCECTTDERARGVSLLGEKEDKISVKESVKSKTVAKKNRVESPSRQRNVRGTEREYRRCVM